MFKTSSQVLLMGLLLVGMASCGGNNTTSPQAVPQSTPQSLPDRQPAKPPTNSPQHMRTQGESSEVNPAPPKDARFTIYCARIEGDMHVQRANRMKAELIQVTKMKDWYVIHENGQSLLYYGYYRSIDQSADPKDAQRAQLDRQKIDLMTDPMGNRPFARAMFVELTAPDPVAPPEWNLINAKGAYSLEIAAYKDSPQRKEAAVETVRAARAQGVQAYYYHGATSSVVCVGAWPEAAVRITQDASLGRGASDQPLMVAPTNIDRDQVLSQELQQVEKQGSVNVVKPKVEIIDPALKSAMKQYPYIAINGMYMKHSVNGTDQYEPSQLVPIPHEQATASSDTPAGIDEAPPHTIPPAAMSQGSQPDRPAYDPNYRPELPHQTAPPTPQPGAGHLRSIGD